MKHLPVVFATLAAFVPPAALAQGDSPGRPSPAGAEARQAAGFVDGEVRRVDKEQGKLTLRHGPIPALDMPNMSMVYRVKDPTMLEGLKPGDKIRFRAEKQDGTYTVTAVEPAGER